MRRKNKIIIAVILVVIGFLLFGKPLFNTFRNTDTVVHKIGCRLYELNTIEVKCDPHLDFWGIDIKSGEQTVFSSGKQIHKIGQAYGHTILAIYYHELLLAEIGHFKTNNWYTNDYEIHLQEQEGIITIDYHVSGPDATNDSFQKRYVRNENQVIERIDFLSRNGEVYHSEER